MAAATGSPPFLGNGGGGGGGGSSGGSCWAATAAAGAAVGGAGGSGPGLPPRPHHSAALAVAATVFVGLMGRSLLRRRVKALRRGTATRRGGATAAAAGAATASASAASGAADAAGGVKPAPATATAAAAVAPGRLTLVVGNKAYSSWSLRAWLALRVAAGREGFVERVVALAGAGSDAQKAELLKYSPTGKVPALFDSEAGLTIWESLAICEYVADLFPEAQLWPSDPAARGLARAVSCEMHSGFAKLREALPMNVRCESVPVNFVGLRKPGVGEDIARICEIWRTCLECEYSGRGKGTFLFGHFTIADAMFAPVVSRFATYQPSLPRHADRYCAAICRMPELGEWVQEARLEKAQIDQYEL